MTRAPMYAPEATKQGSSRVWPRATSAVWETQGGVRAMANAVSLLGRRAFLARLAASGGALGLLSACGGAGNNGAGGAAAPPALAPTADTKLNAPQSIATSGVPVQSATPGPATAPATGQPQPTGQFNYAWHTTISPAWFDPQENPPQITP